MNRGIVQKLVDVVGEACNDQSLSNFLRGYKPDLMERMDDAYDDAKDMLRMGTNNDAELLAACKELIRYWGRNTALTIQVEKLGDHVHAIQTIIADARLGP